MQTVCDVFPTRNRSSKAGRTARYDLLLLDCYLSDDENLPRMPPPDLDIARTAAQIRTTTARSSSSRPAPISRVLGYEVQASGYLLKPVNRKTFEATMERVAEQLDRQNRRSPIWQRRSRPARWIPAGMWRSAIPAVTMDRRLIAYALSNAHYVEFTFADGTQTKIRTNFSDVDQRLTVFDNFYRTARGVLVNFDYVSGITNAQFVMKGGKRIPITKTAVTTTCRAYAEYTFTRMRTED